MADYSGSWFCDECKASGTNYQGKHKEWCSVILAQVLRARGKHFQEEKEKAEREAQHDAWDQLSDDDVYTKLLDLEDEAGEKYYDYKVLKDQVDALKKYLSVTQGDKIIGYIDFCRKQREEEGRYDAVE